MKSRQLAVKYFEQEFNCAQAVLMMFGPSLGLDKRTASRLGAAFGGGMVRSGNTCGAVSGALMVLGLKFGNSDNDDKESKEAAYTQAEAFVKEFKENNSSIVCRDLLGCDLSKPGGLEYARESKLFQSICPKLVRDAADIVEQLTGVSIP